MKLALLSQLYRSIHLLFNFFERTALVRKTLFLLNDNVFEPPCICFSKHLCRKIEILIFSAKFEAMRFSCAEFSCLMKIKEGCDKLRCYNDSVVDELQVLTHSTRLES